MKIFLTFAGCDIRTETKEEQATLHAVVNILQGADLFEGAGKVCQQLLKNGIADLQVEPSASVASVE